MISRFKAGLRAFLNPAPRRSKQLADVSQPELRDIQSFMRQHIKASYDSVARTPENLRHWRWIDNLSADASASPEVRKRIREQARYEVAQNNCYGIGIATTLVNDTIGSGPRLQMQTLDEKTNKLVEQEFYYWTQEIGLREKLATARMAKMIDGESVARITTNLGSQVSVDLLNIECDQLCAPYFKDQGLKDYVDGVRLDRFGNPVSYDILKYHPGEAFWSTKSMEFNTYSADQIIHTFRCDRPGQHRGVSEFASALPLFALLRRFTLATVSAAETAASVSQVIETDSPLPEELEADYASTTFEKYMEAIPIDRNSATVLPNAWHLKQFAAEHPTTTYRMFKQELINEIARVVGMPRNVAAADSSDYNYASGRLDHLAYQKTVRIEQSVIELQILNRLFSEWIVEACLIGVLPQRLCNSVLALNDAYGRRGLAARMPHAWYWDGFEDADQIKTATAQHTKLSNGTTHRAAEYASRGLDVDVEDIRAAKTFGMTVPAYRKLVAMSIFSNGNLLNQQNEDDEGTEDDTDDTSETSEAQTATQAD